ncbi:MAG: TlpA disulfide reductase family protein [Actinomycetota bacterium]|nr:TlpA disulfide reductase family protein [Actinomycetota bacterium]
MKKIFFLVLVLLLSGCSKTEPAAQKGVVVSCESVTRDESVIEGIELECVDGSPGAVIESLRGPMILNVWGSWCTTCLEEMPEFVSFYSKAKGKVQLIGIAVEEASPENSQRFIVKHGMTWPNFYDRENDTRRYFGMGVPVTWFIDASGRAAFKKIGVIESESELVELTEKYLGVKI